jgi:hypothetical protein
MSKAKIDFAATDSASRVMAQVRGNLRQTAESAERVGSALGLVGVAGIATGLGLLTLAKNANDSVDALNDLHDATGASVENISALEDVAARTGTSFDSVGAALVKFNGALKDAKPGSEAEQALVALGLSVEELKKMDPAEALLKTSKALDGFADDGNKARIVQELFGKSLREVAPFLKDLAESGRLVATVTTEQAQEAEKFNKELFALGKNAEDAKRSLLSNLVQGINESAKALRESGLIEGLRTLFTGSDDFKNNKRLVELTDQLLQAENAVSRARAKDKQFGDRSLETAAAEKRLAIVKEELKTVQAFRKVSQSSEKPPEPPKPSAPVIAAKTKAAKGPDQDADFKSYLDNLQRQVEKTQELTNVEQVLAAVQAGRLTVSPAQQSQLTNLAAIIDAEKELTETIKMQREVSIAAGDAVTKVNEERQKQLASLLSATPTAELERQRAAVALLTEEFEAGRLSEEAYLEAVSTRLQLTGQELKTTKTLTEELGLTFNSAFEDAVVSGKKFKDVLKGLLQDIARMVARKGGTEMLGRAILGGIAGGFGFGGDAGPQLLGEGSYGFGGARAEGGPVSPGKAYIVGERRPELFVPDTAGRIIPRVPGGEMQLTIINNTSAPIGRVTQRAISATERALIIEEAVQTTAAQFNDPNSRTSRSLGRNYALARSR